MFRLGKVISHEQASQIIGEHFPNVKDKLLNTLQLNELASQTNNELVTASVEQKTNELRPVSFTNAIDLNKNKKYLTCKF
jgi:hypothetical protein